MGVYYYHKISLPRLRTDPARIKVDTSTCRLVGGMASPHNLQWHHFHISSPAVSQFGKKNKAYGLVFNTPSHLNKLLNIFNSHSKDLLQSFAFAQASYITVNIFSYLSFFDKTLQNFLMGIVCTCACAWARMCV